MTISKNYLVRVSPATCSMYTYICLLYKYIDYTFIYKYIHNECVFYTLATQQS